MPAMSIYDLKVTTLAGEQTTLGALGDDGLMLIVNVASQCGQARQYPHLEALHQSIEALTVVGVPCNQFEGQEPGTAEEIAQFCSMTYGVTFPMLEKSEVNGAGRAPLFDALSTVADSEGRSGDIEWNFEKWLIDRTGRPVARFRTLVTPDDPAMLQAINDAIGHDDL